MRTRLKLALPLLAILLLAAACGSQGYAPPLGNEVQVALPGASGGAQGATATFTPIRALHVAAYYHGVLLPAKGAQTPAQVRSGSCTGPIVAALTDGTPAGSATATPTTSTPIIARPADVGWNISIEPGPNLYVTVLARPNDPTAPVVACGNPLSDRRQYFDLYPFEELGTGVARGTALFEPINVSRIDVNAPGDGTAAPASWAVRSGSCTGATVASGTFTQGLTTATDVIFQTVDPGWWVSVTHADGTTACAQVK